MSRIFTIGESLLDIIFRDGEFVAANAGGAMLNTAVSLGRAGTDVSMISELTDDNAGSMILRFLEENHVYNSLIKRYKEGKTPISIASLDSDGNARYNFYKDYPLKRELEHVPRLRREDMLLFGSLYSLWPTLRKNIMAILAEAKENGSLLIYDPNIRSNHADEVPGLLPMIRENMAQADITRASDEDLFNIFRSDNEEAWITEVLSLSSILIITRGAAGADVFSSNFSLHFDAVETEVVSTVGAGDSFNAGLIFGLLKTKKINLLDENTWKLVIPLAMSFASDCCGSADNYISNGFAARL